MGQPNMTWFLPVAILGAVAAFVIDVMYVVYIYQIKQIEKKRRKNG